MTAQLGDLVEKLGKTEQSVQHRCGIGAMSPIIAAARAAKKNAVTPGSAKETKEETALAKVVKDSFVPFSLSLARIVADSFWGQNESLGRIFPCVNWCSTQGFNLQRWTTSQKRWK